MARSREVRKRPSKLTTGAIVWWGVLFSIVLAAVFVRDNYFHAGTHDAKLSSTDSSRKLMGGAEDWNPVHTEPGYLGPLGWPGIFLWIPMTIWIFSGVAIAADDYFQPALEAISDALGVCRGMGYPTPLPLPLPLCLKIFTFIFHVSLL